MAETTIEEQISIGIQDGFSTALKSMQTQLAAILSPLGQVSVKLDDISKLNLSKTINQLSKMKDSVVDISNAAGRVQFKKDSDVSKAEMNRAIKSNSDFMDVQTQLGLKEIANYERLIDVRLKQLEAKTISTKAYAEDIAKRVSKEVKERNVEADTANKNASANFKNAKAEALLYSGQARFAGGWRGGITSILSHYGTSLRHRPVLGILERYGNRLSQDPDSWMGKRFGKLRGDGKDSWNLNNAFGGILAKGTVKGLGINAGGLALGGFAAGLAGAVTAIEKFRDATLNAYGGMQKLAISMEVVYGSKSESNAAFGQLQQYATHSPFSVSETTEMAILLKQSGVYASDLQSTLEMIGDVSSGNEEKMKRIANNYAQIQAIGHANMLDMRQFAYAGLPIYEEVAKTMNTSQQALRSMISNGEVTAEIIEETFKRMTGEGGMFFKSVQKGSKAYAARQINLEDVKNISLANWGEYFWDNGNGIRGSWLTAKENFWNTLGNMGKNNVINQNYTNNLQSSAYLNALKNAYAQALEENNAPQAEMLKKSILEARAAGYGEDEIKSAFSEKLFKDMGWADKTLVEDSDIEALRTQLEYIVRSNAKGTTGYIESTVGARGFSVPEGYREKMNESYLQYFLSNPGKVDVSTLGFTNKAALKQAETYAETLSTMISRSQVLEKLYELAEGSSKATEALAALQVDLTSFAKTSADATNKLARASSSLSSRLIDYEQTYEQTPEAKAKRERERFEQYQKDKVNLERFNKFFNSSNDTFKKGNFTRQDLIDFYGSGLVSATSLDWENTMFDKGVTPEERKENTGLLLRKLDSALTQFEVFKDSDLTEGDKSTIAEIKKLRENANKWINGRVWEKNLGAITTSLSKIVNGKTTGISKNIVQSIFQDFNAPESIAKYVSSLQGESYIPLWKRIMGGATGWDPEQIRGNAGSFLNTYQTAQSRNIVGGAIKGMVEAGYSMQRIADSFEYENRTNKLENTRQIDWNKTLESYFAGGVFGGDTKAQAKITTRLAESTKAAIAVYDTLKEKAFTTAEDWGNISKHFSNDDKVFLANAFAGGLKAYSKEGGPEYNLTEDASGRYVLNDASLEKFGLNGMTIEEAKNAVKNNSNVSDDLRKSIETLNSTTESVTSALDRYQDQLKLTSTRLEAQSAFVNAGADARNKGYEASITAMAGSRRLQAALGFTDNEQEKMIPVLTNLIKNASALNLSKYKSYDDYTADMYKQGKGPESIVGIDTFRMARDFNDYLKTGDYNEALTLVINYLKDVVENTSALKNDFAAGETDTRKSEYRSYVQERIRNLPTDFYESLGDYKYQKSFDYSDGTSNTNSILEQAFMNRNGMGDKDYKEFMEAAKEEFNTDDEGFIKKIFDEESLGRQIANIGQSLHDMWDNVPAQMISETFSTWGESLAKGESASANISENLKAMGAGLLSNTGQMLTQAGLALAISSIGNRAMVMKGLAIAAAGAGMSFLGGMMGAKEEDDETDEEYKRLNQIKDDLSELLKQAREDAIYYENTVRHRKALSTNGSISVNDAIITPSGQVISTHPDDYLIATKTPQSLVGGGGTPVVNFSVIDKSTGIKVTKQKTTYDEDSNSMNLEVVIESKVQEIIASSKGDAAFNARQMRLNGNSYVG